MEATIYRQMADIQATHWWFVARRRILAEVLSRLDLPSNPRILEVGCGPGGNLAMLAGFGRLSAMELDDYAVEVARRVPRTDVRKGWLPDGIPFEPGVQFDLACLFDVLEHIEDDVGALRALVPLFAAGGKAVVTVPAHPWLYGPHDRAHHHFRRYTAGGFAEVARSAGYRVRRVGHFSTLLFPLIVAMRLLAKLGVTEGGDDARMPGDFANRVLAAVFGAERHVVAHAGFPFGASLIAVLEPHG